MLYEGVKNLCGRDFIPSNFRDVLATTATTIGSMDDVTVGFSRSERSRNKFERSFNCSERMIYGRKLKSTSVVT
jgi:hypothetical protein